MLKYLPFLNENEILTKIPNEVLLEALLHAKFKTLRSKTVLYAEGSTDDNVYIVLSGALRAYFEFEGREMNSMFYKKGELIGNINSIFSDDHDHSWLTMETVMPTVVIYITKDYLFKLLEKYPVIKYRTFDVFLWSMLAYESKQRLLLCYPAKERYLKFAEQFGKYVKHFQAKDIASYLSITPETLSRVKKEIASEP